MAKFTKQTIRLKLKDVKLNKNNPRHITKDKLAKLVKSIREFPEMTGIRPIIVDEDSIILGGNMRYRALKQLGYEDIEVVQVTGLTEEQKKEFIVKDNLPYGDWDWDELSNSWDVATLEDWGLDIPDMPDQGEIEIIEDAPPTVSTEAPASKPGEVYMLGRHRVICGDSTDHAIIDKLMDEQRADLLLTDPPYGVGYVGKAKKVSIDNDGVDGEKLEAFLRQALGEANNHLKLGGAFYVFYASSMAREVRQAVTANVGLHIAQDLVWVKNHLILSHNDYHYRHEPIIYGFKEGASHYFIADRSLTTVYEKVNDIDSMSADALRALLKGMLETAPQTVIKHDKPNKSLDHPTMKPVGLMAYLINNSTQSNELVLDPFLGSGSTLMACEQIGRICYGAELSPEYVDVIRKRWWKFRNNDDETGWEENTPASV